MHIVNTTCAALLISALALPAGAVAQTPSQVPAEIIREAVKRESIRLAALPPVSRQQAPRQRSWPGRHPVLFGALAGLGIGIVVETATIPGASGGEPHSVYLPMFGIIGAGIGSVTGLIISASR
ncbi:MAG TPA: hypothetical protein VL243_06035 [Vicinamibacterales bacterium]|jgi:hypothetical protein|nr:hypothetical protein [Vicinamibacterales bacterium]